MTPAKVEIRHPAKVYLVCLIPAVTKYNEIVYKIVSVLESMIAPIFPIIESAPYSFNKSIKSPVAAEPEKDFTIARGTNGAGKQSRAANG